MLIGDAASCVSLLAGEGTGLAMTEAYLLAGELNRAGDDYREAFRRHEQRCVRSSRPSRIRPRNSPPHLRQDEGRRVATKPGDEADGGSLGCRVLPRT